jgi:glycosyltransferase involved in cell wall biosynthesis
VGKVSVAVVNAYTRFSGSTIAARDYWSALHDLRYDPHWYQCVDTTDVSEYTRDGRLVYGLTTPIKSLNIGVNRLAIFPRRLRRLDETLVLATDPVLLGLTAGRASCVVVFHDLRELDGHPTNVAAPFLFEFLLPKARQARGVISVSEFTKRQVEARVKDLPEIAVIPRSTRIKGDPNNHIPNSARRLSEERKLEVLYVAADRPYKNIAFLFNVMRRIGKSLLGVSFSLHLLSHLKSRSSEDLRRNPVPNLNIDSTVEDIVDAYDSADILAFPSLYEGFGLPLVEAMQFGLPILANNLEPMSEIVQNGGMLLPPNDVEAWVKALIDLTNPDTYRLWARRSAERGANFSHERFKERLSGVLNRWGFPPE